MIKTERLSIRRVCADDWKAIQAIWVDASKSVYAKYDKPNELDDPHVFQRIARWDSFRDSDEHIFFAVCLASNIIGYVTFHRKEKAYEIGYCFHSDYHRKGYAKESISALLDIIKAKRVSRVEAGTALNNLPSVKLLIALGFAQIGTEPVSFYQDAKGNGIVFEGGVFALDFPVTTLTKMQARSFILAKQGLLGDYRFCGKDGAYAYVRQAGCIQYDPVDVCGKNAELTLQSRVKSFKKTMLEELLYKDRLLVDYADKELSIWPTADWPYFAAYRSRSRALGESFAGLAELEREALAHIRENGPVSSDTLPIEGEIFWHSSMHWSGNWHKKSPAARSVLEQLYTDGVLVIHHKKGSRKFYDLAERHLDAALLAADPPYADDDALLRWRVLRRIGAIGLLWNKNSSAFLGLELNAERRRAVFSALEASGAILSAMIDGIKTPFYYRAEDASLMRAVVAGTLDDRPRMELLAPLDPMLWDKALIAALWDFRYSWEIYTPADKRKYGYYTLPVLRGTDFIGRIETVADRKAGVLRVKNVWLEPGVRRTKKLDDALARTLSRFARFNDCSTVELCEKSARL